MPKHSGVTYEQAKRIGLAFPEVAESTSYGTPALKVRGKLMIRLKEDDETLVCRSSWEERERRLALAPDVFFLTEHYRHGIIHGFCFACRPLRPCCSKVPSSTRGFSLPREVSLPAKLPNERPKVLITLLRACGAGPRFRSSGRAGTRLDEHRRTAPPTLRIPLSHMPNVSQFTTTNLRRHQSEIAPDGSAVRPLLALSGGTMAHFELSPGQTSRAVVHRTVEEFWFVVSGKGGSTTRAVATFDVA